MGDMILIRVVFLFSIPPRSDSSYFHCVAEKLDWMMVEMVRKLVVNEWQWLLVEMISLIRGDDHSDPSSLSASFSSSPPLSSSLPSLSALAFEDQYFNIFIAVDFDISTTTAPTSDTYQRVPLSNAFWEISLPPLAQHSSLVCLGLSHSENWTFAQRKYI